MMRKKLGLIGEKIKDEKLIMDLLTWMHKNKADYTNTFCFLMNQNIKKIKYIMMKIFLIGKNNGKHV